MIAPLGWWQVITWLSLGDSISARESLCDLYILFVVVKPSREPSFVKHNTHDATIQYNLNGTERFLKPDRKIRDVLCAGPRAT